MIWQNENGKEKNIKMKKSITLSIWSIIICRDFSFFFLKKIYIIKQNIRISVPPGRPITWAEWADTFWGNPWAMAKQIRSFFQRFFSFKIYIFFQGQRRSLQLVGYKAELAFPKRITLQRHSFLSRYSVQPWVWER